MTVAVLHPRKAARIFLRVTDVRVERVQDITPDNCLSEGIYAPSKDMAVDFFMELWDSLNAKRGYSWHDNPWVWVIEFEKIPS